MEKRTRKKLRAIAQQLLKNYPGYFDNEKQRTNIIKGHNAVRKYKPKDKDAKPIDAAKDYTSERLYNPLKNMEKHICQAYEEMTDAEQNLPVTELIGSLVARIAPHYGLIQQN